MTRINITLGNETLALVDRYAEAMGVPRSNLCAVLIAQGLMSYNPALLAGVPGSPTAPAEGVSSLGERLAAARAEAQSTL